MTRRNLKRKTTSGHFALLPVTVLSTDAVKTLHHAAFRVLVLLAAEYNGHNNGAVGLTRSQVAVNGIGSDHTLYSALRTLEKRGLSEQTYPASRVPPRPTMYALTWISVDATEWSQSKRIPVHTYRDWRPSRKPKLKVVRNKVNTAG